MSVLKKELSIITPKDNGNIVDLNDDPNAIDPNNIRLAIRGDRNKQEWFQWFNFDLKYQHTSGVAYILNIENAKDVKYPYWNNFAPYQVYASYGYDDWFNVPTTYDEVTGKLTMVFRPEEGTDQVKFAFFPPYTYERHLTLIEKARAIPQCQVTTLGKTNGEQGRDITLLTFGEPAQHKKEIWIIARQHPGEPQAEWYVEGLIEALRTEADLFEKFTFRIVPNMNPDGTYDGNLRTNGEGNDLNRMWESSTIQDSPEVYLVKQAMQRIGVDFFVDVHSDEEIPEPFLDEGHLSSPTIDAHMEALEKQFMDFYIMISRDMQNVLNYGPKDRTNPINITIAACHVAEYFNCPSFTLEMPTKNWSVPQCKQLSRDFLEVLSVFSPQLLGKATNVDSRAGAKPERPRSPGDFSIFEEQHKGSSPDSKGHIIDEVTLEMPSYY
ncbi:MAG: M14-type cytosolic carboxypeptidase [Legionellaceae bacterium]|nr:M14-type cytosolic carboxypeptidase [Legionellaceae bacterium]